MRPPSDGSGADERVDGSLGGCYERVLARRAPGIPPEEWSDALAEAVLHMLRSPPQCLEPGQADAYLRQAAKHCWSNMRRRRKQHGALPAELPAPQDAAGDRAGMRRLRCIAKLRSIRWSARQLELIELVVGGGHPTWQSIAVAMGTTRQSVMRIVAAIVRRARAELAEENLG
jgi:DNA-directed RNA polymerase specialized sigma24 family protein